MTLEFCCPSCKRRLRAPETAQGRQVKCPRCGGIFLAPLMSSMNSAHAEGASTAPQGLSQAPPIPSSSTDSWGAQASYGTGTGFSRLGDVRTTASSWASVADSTAMLSRVSSLGTCLMVLSIIDMILIIVLLLVAFFQINVGGAVADEGADFAANSDAARLILNGAFNMIWGTIYLGITVITLIGSIKMRRLEGYGLAMTAAILSIIPCTSPCCFLIGTPIGVWALVLLLDPAVKQAFR